MDAIILNHPNTELTLYGLSLISAGISFWEQPEIKRDIRNYSVRGLWELETWHEITRKVLDLADRSDMVIGKVLPELKDAILNTSMKIFNWIRYCVSDLGLDESYAEDILWTPLGFVNEVKIFNCFWKDNASLYEDDKPIFRIACMFAQEEFIEKHLMEITEELKKLTGSKNMENYSDKIYGIISTYIIYYANQDVYRMKQKHHIYGGGDYHDLFCALNYYIKDQTDILKSLNNKIIAPHLIMLKLCAFLGYTHATRYYYKKLICAEKEELNIWIENYYKKKYCDLECNNHELWKCNEIKAFIYHSYFLWKNEKPELLDVLLRLCPLESVARTFFNEFLNQFRSRGYSHWLENYITRLMKHDYKSKLPKERNLYQKLLKQSLIGSSNSKIQRKKEESIDILIDFSITVRDFTILRSYLDRCKFDSEYLRQTLCRIHLKVDEEAAKKLKENFYLYEQFFADMFNSSHDRIELFTEQIYRSQLLVDSNFELWEKWYVDLNVVDTPFDPFKCLHYIAENGNIKAYDNFIKRCHKSEQDQINFKNQFKNSACFLESIYGVWLWTNSYVQVTETLLKYYFKSEDEIVQFKKKRLSVYVLLNASFTPHAESWSFYNCEINSFHERIDDFIDFCETSPETLKSVKQVIRDKFEELILTHSTVRNVLTLNFLMDWISLTEKEKRRIFQKLYESSKILKLCIEILNVHSVAAVHEEIDIFYNDWLRVCGNISELKAKLISIYENEKDEEFMLEISTTYEVLERGEHFYVY